MNQVWVIADTHFGHAKVITFRPWKTVEEHDRELIARWNATVKKHDTVWHLGDVLLGGQAGHSILLQLNGTKRLVMGNHDAYPVNLYLKYFTKVFGAAELHNCILTHVPVHPCQLEKRYKKNIHGHLHDKKLDDPRYRCVSVEQTDYRPILLKSILETIT